MKEKIEQGLRQALTKLWSTQTADLIPNLDFIIEHPRDPSHGDWSSNIALLNAKLLKMSPKAIAEQLISLFPPNESIAKIEIAGPGFINFYQSTNFLSQSLEQMWHSERLGVEGLPDKSRVVVDYSSPNLAKEMHVGHLRSTIIGDAIARIMAFKGYEVIRQNHVGDWGTQFGMLLAHFVDLQDQASDLNLTDLEVFYKEAKAKFDDDAEFAERSRQWVVLLQSGDQQCLSLWKQFIDLSLAHAQEIYQRLGVELCAQDVRPESFYNQDLPTIIRLLKEQGLLVQHQGANCVFLPQFKGKNDDPLPIIVQKNDGGFLYASTDLAAIRYRHQVLKASRVLYVVDARQALHFEQVFALAKLAGFAGSEMELEHISFGMVLDAAGRPFKSREGGVTKLSELLTEAVRRARMLLETKGHADAELDKMADIIGISAVKYADLSKNRTSDYIFDWDTMISFEGNTAPYLLYAYTRIISLFAKAKRSMADCEGQFAFEQVQELALAKQLALFPELIDNIVLKASPHLLCAYLYDLAGLFSAFYEHCSILNHPMEKQRLRLAALTARVLKQGLGLLGIQTLERM